MPASKQQFRRRVRRCYSSRERQLENEPWLQPRSRSLRAYAKNKGRELIMLLLKSAGCKKNNKSRALDNCVPAHLQACGVPTFAARAADRAAGHRARVNLTHSSRNRESLCPGSSMSCRGSRLGPLNWKIQTELLASEERSKSVLTTSFAQLSQANTLGVMRLACNFCGGIQDVPV